MKAFHLDAALSGMSVLEVSRSLSVLMIWKVLEVWAFLSGEFQIIGVRSRSGA